MADKQTYNVDHDELIAAIQRQAGDEYARASDASESGARLKKYLEGSGLNSQAFSTMKMIMKKLPKKDGAAKAMDIIRSLEIGLPMIKNHVNGQQGEMNLDAGSSIGEDSADFDAHADEALGDNVEPFDGGGELAAE